MRNTFADDHTWPIELPVSVLRFNVNSHSFVLIRFNKLIIISSYHDAFVSKTFQSKSLLLNCVSLLINFDQFYLFRFSAFRVPIQHDFDLQTTANSTTDNRAGLGTPTGEHKRSFGCHDGGNHFWAALFLRRPTGRQDCGLRPDQASNPALS